LEFIRASLGQLQLAVELRLISSVLDAQQGQALRLLDPRPLLGQEGAAIRHIGLLRTTNGPPLGLCLGEVRGVARLDAGQLYSLPPWLRQHLPSLLYPACALDPSGELLWLLNPRPLWEKPMSDAAL
jgi:hypothetical protein